MSICNCGVAKVNDDDDDVQCNTECVGGCLVATTTRKYYQPPPLSLSHTHTGRIQKCLASTIAHLQPILHFLHLSPSSPSRPPDYKHHKPHLG